MTSKPTGNDGGEVEGVQPSLACFSCMRLGEVAFCVPMFLQESHPDKNQLTC